MAFINIENYTKDIPKVRTCCFIINLKTGALILGWLGSVFSAMWLFHLVWQICLVHYIREDVATLSENSGNNVDQLNNYLDETTG